MNKQIILSNGVTIPQVGLGVWKAANDGSCENAVKWALAAGYGHIDTASEYGNETSVGLGIKNSKVKRSEIFLTTKLWNENIRQHRTKAAYQESLDRLGVDYVDLYLIHWPADGFEDAWKEMEELYQEGKIRAIGVSNFHEHHLEALEKIWTVKPMVNQIESHPYFTNQKLIDYCMDKGIQVSVWSPLGGSAQKQNTLEDPVLKELAEKYHKSAAQIIIRWDIQRGVVVIPKSVHQERINANLDVFDFELSNEDMERISSLNRNIRVGSDPDNFNF